MSHLSIAKISSVLGLIIALFFILSLFGYGLSFDFPRVSNSKWQAVFFSNGQVYFGHLENYNWKYVRLKDIYYLRVAEPLQQGQKETPSLNLVKLGSELHGPEDAMFIPKDKIIFWENLKDSSRVVEAISSAKK